jgi:hypothetical protein
VRAALWRMQVALREILELVAEHEAQLKTLRISAERLAQRVETTKRLDAQEMGSVKVTRPPKGTTRKDAPS